MPALSLSLFLVAIGAILTFAVTATISGIEIRTVGAILMAVGFVGALFSMLFWTSFWSERHVDSSGTVHDHHDRMV